MNDNLKLIPGAAGVDTATGHGAESFINSDKLSDPWGEECLSMIIDSIINHEKLIYPLPSRKHESDFDISYLPYIYQIGVHHDWFYLKSDTSTHDVFLDHEQLLKEFNNFSAWVSQNAKELKVMLKYQQTPEKKNIRNKFVPEYLIDKVWDYDEIKILTKITGITEQDLRLVFNALSRTIQYYEAIGEDTPYFPHPSRQGALPPNKLLINSKEKWSFGRYLTSAIKRQKIKSDLNYLLDIVMTIRQLCLKREISYYTLGDYKKDDEKKIIESVAAECGLPAKIKDDILRTIRIAFTTASVVSAPFLPMVSMIIGVGAVGVSFWEGDVSAGKGVIKALKGSLEWPELARII